MISLHKIIVGQGATGFALKSRGTVRNVEPDLDFFLTQPDLTQIYKTMVSIPLIADEELIGAVTIYSSELESYGEEHIRLLDTISRIAADAVHKSLEHDEAKTHALTDPMTGLPNARSLQTQFAREVARANRTKSSFQMVMLDLDGFKAVNDSFGHKAGDRLLKEISQVILGQLREYDFLARYGGDEFVALIPESVPEDVTELSKRIEASVAAFELKINDDRVAKVGVSLGSSSFGRFGGDFDEMIAAADKAMYLPQNPSQTNRATRRLPRSDRGSRKAAPRQPHRRTRRHAHPPPDVSKLKRLRKSEVDMILRQFVERVWADGLADDEDRRV